MSLDTSVVQYDAKEISTKMANPDTRQLEETEEGQTTEWSGKSSVGDAGMETRRDEGRAR